MILRELFNSALDFIAPRHCLVCNDPLGTDSRSKFVCRSCLDKMPLAPDSEELFNIISSNFSGDDISLSGIFSLIHLSADYKYSELIYAFKYYGVKKMGEELTDMLADIMHQTSDCKYDLIIPVPIHKARKRERGFNQSDIIAARLSEILAVPYKTDLIKRKSYTLTQTKLNHELRKTNISNVIVPAGNLNINGKHILVVDDVLTTGSTMNETCTCLLNMGAKRTDAATLAYA